MKYLNYLLIFEAILEAGLLYILISKTKKSASKKVFLFYVLGIIGWVFGIAMFRLSTSIDMARFWAIVYYNSASLIAVSLFVFSFLFPGPKKSIGKQKTALAFLPFIFFFIFIPTKYFINEVVIGDPNIVHLGSLYHIFSIWFLLYFSILYYQFFKNYFKEKKESIHKLQLRYVLIGTLISGVMGVVFNLILPWIGNYKLIQIGPAFSIVWLSFITYAIVTQRFLDIRLVIRKSFIYVGLAIFVFVAYYSIVWFDQTVFGGLHTPGAYLSALIFAPLFLIGFSFVGKSLRHIANKYFFTGLYDYQEVLETFAKNISQTINLDEVISVIIRTVQDSMRVDNIAMALPDPAHKHPFLLHKTIGFNNEELENICESQHFCSYLQEIKKPIVLDELLAKQEKARELDPHLATDAETLKKLGISLILPFVMKGNINSICIVGSKITKEAYTKEDIELLTTLSNQAAIAIENARLYNNMEEIVEEQTGEIKEKNLRLQQLLKMKSDFLSIASHQLRTPLTAIRGLLAMQAEGDLEKLPKTEQKKEQQHMLESANRLSNIVNDLLDAMELEGGHLNFQFKDVNVVEILNQIAEDLKPNYDKKGITLTMNVPKDFPPIEAEPKMLHEALENIIDNAEKYTNKGGVTVTLSRKKKHITIEVKDTGIGIPQTDKPRLFEKFSRGEKSSYQHTDGSGLGLFIAKNVITEHHGDISVESEGEGKGTTVTITLPTTQPQHNEK